MSGRTSHLTGYNYSKNNYSKMCGDSSRTDYKNHCSCDGTCQYPYPNKDHDVLRRMAIKNYTVTRSLDGKPVYSPINDRPCSCDCNLENTKSSQFEKHDKTKGRLKKGCDCHKRSGMEAEYCQSVQPDHRRCCRPQNPRSATQRTQCDAHQHRMPASAQHPRYHASSGITSCSQHPTEELFNIITRIS